ncbi:hypothetical protein GRI39_07045 [Altererythrobacter indicus]|uniref:Uncharacterized protein n=1 Tax=Altericroceibacterium indicum TaxID=374177 RepID=A0A845AB70_9SPHN|nr:hypothetical protein [Altericroceibacterium indicum]
MAGEDWTAPEIDAAVADYFAMLTDDIAGIRYNKAAHNRGLQKANLIASLAELCVKMLSHRPSSDALGVVVPPLLTVVD